MLNLGKDYKRSQDVPDLSEVKKSLDVVLEEISKSGDLNAYEWK